MTVSRWAASTRAPLARPVLSSLLLGFDAACGAARTGEEPLHGSCEPNAQAFIDRPTPSPATLPFIHAAGTDVVDEHGDRVGLRGVNFGRWLLIESSIPGIEETNLDCSDWNDALIERCAELGCKRTMQVGVPFAHLQHFVAQQPCAEVTRFLREWTTANAFAGEGEALARFWQWYDAIPNVTSEQDPSRSVTDRFGFDRSQALRRAYRERWIDGLGTERFQTHAAFEAAYREGAARPVRPLSLVFA